MNSPAPGSRPQSVYRRTLIYYRPFLAATIAGLALNLATVGFSLLKPWPFKFLVDDVLTPAGDGARAAAVGIHAAVASMDPAVAILALCAALVAIHLLWGTTNLFGNFILIRASLRALLRIRTQLYAYLQSLPLKYHDSRRSADSSFRVAYDSQSIQTIYNKGLSGLFTAATSLVGTSAVMLWMDWQLTLLSLSILPFVVWAVRHFAVRIRADSTHIQEQESALLAEVTEGLAFVRMVQAFNQQAYEVSQFKDVANRSLTANLRLNVTSLKSALVIGTLMAAGTAVLYYIGSNHVLSGRLSLGELLVFAAYLTTLYQPLEALSYTAWALEGAAAGARRCFEVLDNQDDVPDAPDAQPLQFEAGAIRFDRVLFSYDDGSEILQDIDLAVSPGETVAIVGGTGAGKSTLLGLVPRFYDPTRGRVLIDNQDLRSVTKASLRGQIGVVLQDTLLFSTTVRENIAYGRPGATEEEIVRAAKLAEAHEFIEARSGGYDSNVGERGGHLSVGQRQRIGIARAFLKNAPMLLLDEPTSALDPRTEAAIMRALRRLMEGRTTILVTHRIFTVHDAADRIVVLERGRIAESGTGTELLARGGVYTGLYRANAES